MYFFKDIFDYLLILLFLILIFGNNVGILCFAGYDVDVTSAGMRIPDPSQSGVRNS